ncbi:hypothetical protein LCGC14_0475590 [marine sediment metagenome]|uniref:Uncharacterized protein n=1 Tax=marine sediment metagenome TaxID=412755 RepID=A0A0F9UXW8_9ZZZZ
MLDQILKYCIAKEYSFEVIAAMVDKFNEDEEFWQSMELSKLHDFVVYGEY